MTSDFLDNYKHKILDSKALAELVGNRPRKRKVVMCHGVFDVVHPGHIRHFLYAKSKADLLIVSLTADKHINKGENRPHVPEDLRALNLAALDFVDYVLIDPSETPIENIKQIEPDIFAKGFEYSDRKNKFGNCDREFIWRRDNIHSWRLYSQFKSIH
jgi:cytidyltransferase-like protein